MKPGLLKKIGGLIFFILMCVAELAGAQVAAVFDLTGTAQAIPGAGSPRNLRKGDLLNQGDTIATGESSNIILRFDDGQIVALTPKSRFTISNYVYNSAEPAKSNVLLSLIQGGMRAVTGLIGKRNPDSVSYRAAQATIGIRGTDASISTDSGLVSVVVHDGMLTFTLPGQQPVSIPAGQGLIHTPDGKSKSAPAAQVIAALKQLAADQKAAASAPGATQAQKDAAAAAEHATDNMIAALQTTSSSSITSAITAAANPPAAPSSTSTPGKNPNINPPGSTGGGQQPPSNK